MSLIGKLKLTVLKHNPIYFPNFLNRLNNRLCVVEFSTNYSYQSYNRQTWKMLLEFNWHDSLQFTLILKEMCLFILICNKRCKDVILLRASYEVIINDKWYVLWEKKQWVETQHYNTKRIKTRLKHPSKCTSF